MELRQQSNPPSLGQECRQPKNINVHAVTGTTTERSIHEKLYSYKFVLVFAREGMIFFHSDMQAGTYKLILKKNMTAKSCGSSTVASILSPFQGYIQLFKE